MPVLDPFHARFIEGEKEPAAHRLVPRRHTQTSFWGLISSLLRQNPQQPGQLTSWLGIMTDRELRHLVQNAQQTGQVTGLLGILLHLSQLAHRSLSPTNPDTFRHKREIWQLVPRIRRVLSRNMPKWPLTLAHLAVKPGPSGRQTWPIWPSRPLGFINGNLTCHYVL